MLNQLSIQNFALIDQVEIDFNGGLSVITGETGAGKSILLGALGLILGKRADHSVLKDTSRKCIVEGVFDLRGYKLSVFFEKNDLDYSDSSILRREINGNGKSRSFINDTPCTLDVLKKLGSQLIDIHSQQQTLQLNDSQFQLKIIDALAENDKLLLTYQKDFLDYQDLKNRIRSFEQELAEAKQQEDYLNFQFKELEELNLKAGENDVLEQEQKRFANSEDILKNLSEAQSLLTDKEDNIIGQLSALKQCMQQSEQYDSDFTELLGRVSSTLIELQDVASEVEAKSQDFEYDPQRHQVVEERLGEIHRLQKKHICSEADGLIEIKETIESQLLAVSNSDEQLKSLEKELNQINEKLTTQANKLTKKRKASLPSFQTKVEETLQNLGIPFACLRVEHQIQNDFTKSGKDAFEFLFSANKGIDPSKVSKTASGGETSRLMLAIKEIMAQHQQLPTILFDEIDTGLSGEIAEKMGTILAKMGKQRQVMSITHLPQLAAKGEHHYFVYKDVVNDRSITQLKKLTDEERISELAKMLSGSTLTEAALNNAKELLHD
ncbi:MAG: DNA repair protein RecN (Recombination protein N) [Vicingaceae bacterium]|jgi:DNA repair protein RecN (Recombination protein N)